MASGNEASCVNDPNFAIICSFFEKFSSMLNIQQPDIHTLQEWLENSEEVAPGLRQLHIKLLRKMRKTVHETAWETALAKFCYLYSSQDAWEIERFGYKKSSLKVKLRILTAILEYQFQLNGKFRNKFSNMTAEELRSEPIGRDRLGHSYWLTQDPSCNFRIYQEHLDEEIWQVVASNRTEMETLVSRLKGNEVVLPSLIGVIDEDSSSNSCANAIIKPPPPEEQDDSQSSSCGSNTKAKVPNIKIKLENGNVVETNGDLTNGVSTETIEKPAIKPEVKEQAEDEDEEESSDEEEEEAEEEEDEEEESDDDEGEEEEEEEDYEGEDDRKEVAVEETKSEDVTVKIEDTKLALTNGNLKDEVVTANGKKPTPRKLKPLVISNAKVSTPSEDKSNTKKRALSIGTNGEPETEQHASKKSRPTLSDDRRGKKSKYEKSSEEEDDDDEEEGDEDEDEEEEEDEEAEENDDEAINGEEADGDEEMENDEEKQVGEAIEEETVIVKGEGSGKDCESSSSSCFLRKIDFGCDDNEEQVGEAIEEEVMYIYGEGSGQCCLVGNPADESNESVLVKHSKEIDLQTKTKQVDIKLSEPDENKNDDSKNCMTNGEICDDKEEGIAQSESKAGIVDGRKATNDKPTTTNEKETTLEKTNEKEDTKTDATKNNATDGTDNHKNSGPITSSEQVASPTLSKTKDASSILEKETKSESKTAGFNVNNSTSDAKDAPKSNFDLDRSTEPPDIQTDGIATKDDDPSSVLSDFALAKSRKRRLSEDKISRDLSESESDLNSDSAAPPTEEEDIGGKRPKMRLKVVNTEIRKKVEQARKSHEDAKSTSEEEGTTEDKNGDDCEEENDPLQISEQDRQKAEATQIDTSNVPEPVLIQTRTTRHTPAGTPIKPVTTSGRGRKKPGKQRYTKRIPDIPSLELETPLAEGETRSEDDADTNKMPKLEPATGPEAQPEVKDSSGQKKQRGLKRDIDTSNIIDAQSEIPVRQSRRIAQLKIREEAERRKMEEEALKKMKAEFKKKKKEEITSKGMPVPSDTSEKSEEDSEAEEGKKFSPKKKGGRMWKKSGWSSGPDEPEEDDEYDLPHERYDSERGSPLFKSDHEFSPESDIEDESQAVPLKRARTVRKEGVEYDGSEMDESCQKCGKNDHPEWILLCDKCDKGYHCSCLSPVLFIIPEGDWFCPPCQQEQLIAALEKQMTVLDDAIEQKQRREEEAKRRAEVELKLKEEEEQQQAKEDDEEPEKKGVKSQAKKNRAERAAKRRNRPKGRKSFIADDDDESDESDASSGSGSSSDESESGTKSSSKTSDSDDEPIYKLRKRRQVNVSYRLNEYEHLINSAIKEEMDEVAGAGNLGRGKDISTIIEADKEEKMRQNQMTTAIIPPEETTIMPQQEEIKEEIENGEEKVKEVEPEVKEEEKVVAPVKSKSRSMSKSLKKKNRKLNNLDISSDDDGSDEDFKTSSYETEEDESISEATDSDSSLEVYRKRGKKNKRGKKGKTKRPQRRAARQRRRLDDFIVEDSEWSDEAPKRRKVKRKHNWELQDTESEDELSDQIDSEELCDDTTDSEDSDGCWRPSKRRKTKAKRKGGKSKSASAANRLGPHGGKQPRKFNRKNSGERSFKSKSKSKSKLNRDSDDSDEDFPRTRGNRFTYLDSFDEESSDGGIKPGVKRPDTPPEEREKFIKKQEEIKRMLAEKNTEAAKAVATPTLAPVDSLSTVPLSVIKGAKALDLDYLQRKGELNSDEGETDFDEDLPDDFDPEAMDEEEIAKMMEEEDFAQQQIKFTNDVIRPKRKDNEPLEMPQMRSYPVAAPPPPRESSGPQLQEPPRKRLPMPTIHPPLSGMPRFLPPGARVPYDTPIRQHLPSTVPLSMQSAMQARPMASGIGGGMPPGHSVVIPSVVGAQATHPVAGQNQNSGAELAKPRGRRKKITPLRDTLQKQQAAAAAAAAASTVTPGSQPSNVAAVKDACLAPPENSPAGVMGGPAQLSVAQPPQLYAPPTSTPPSVITRMPQVSSVPPTQQPPLLTQGPPQHRPSRPPFPEQNSRFYSPPNQIPPHRMSIIRHGAPMPPPPHHPLGPNFASGPPPLRPASPRIPASVGNAVVNRQPSPRPLTTFSPNDQYGAARPPPGQQHPTPQHAYRPPLYGTPGYPPAPPQQSQNPMHPTAPDYSNVPTSYGPTPPYGGPYYPPPPPPQQNIGPAHSTPPAPAVSSVPVSSPLPLPTMPASVPASTPPQPAPPIANVTTASTPPHSMPIPVTPIAETTIVGQASQASRPKASVLETFDTKSRSPLLEADVPSSPYSNSAIAEDHEEENLVTSPPANTTSEFSGLVSYFSSQHDDLNS